MFTWPPGIEWSSRRDPVERDTLYHEVVRARPAEKAWATGRKLAAVGESLGE